MLGVMAMRIGVGRGYYGVQMARWTARDLSLAWRSTGPAGGFLQVAVVSDALHPAAPQ